MDYILQAMVSNLDSFFFLIILICAVFFGSSSVFLYYKCKMLKTIIHYCKITLNDWNIVEKAIQHDSVKLFMFLKKLF